MNNHYPDVARTKIYPGAHHVFLARDVDQTWTEEVWIGPYGHAYESTVRWNEEVAEQSSKDALGFLEEVVFSNASE